MRPPGSMVMAHRPPAASSWRRASGGGSSGPPSQRAVARKVRSERHSTTRSSRGSPPWIWRISAPSSNFTVAARRTLAAVSSPRAVRGPFSSSRIYAGLTGRAWPYPGWSGGQDRADRQWSSGDIPRATATLEGILETHEESFGTLYRLGIFALEHDVTKATELLARAEALDPAHPGPVFFSAMALFPLSRFDEANGILERAYAMGQARLGYSLAETTEVVRGALDALYSACSDELYGLALWRTGSTADAADVVQEVFVRLAGGRLRLAGVADLA